MQHATPFPDRYDLPPLARLETNWVPPWLIARIAQHGPWHFGDGAPMDDSHVIGGTSGAFWMVAADGVGTQPSSRHGSSAACRALDHYLGAALKHGASPTRALLVAGFATAHDAIQCIAVQDNRPAYEYATTLAAVIVKGNTIIAAAVGDSSIAVGTNHENAEGVETFALTSFCSAPQPGSGTYTIADPNWPHYVASTEAHAPHVTTVIVATDGADNYYTKPTASGTAFWPEWPSTLEGRLAELGPLQFVNAFAHVIQNLPPENQDDRTLLVACKAPAGLAPPAPQPR